jgi:hypothetical protein
VQLIPEATQEKIVIESDSLELVSPWQIRRNQRSEIAATFDDVQQLVSVFTSFEIRHVNRLTNYAAHICAQHASSSCIV